LSLLESQAHKESEGHRGYRGHKVSKENQGHKVFKESEGLGESEGHRVSQERVEYGSLAVAANHTISHQHHPTTANTTDQNVSLL